MSWQDIVQDVALIVSVPSAAVSAVAARRAVLASREALRGAEQERKIRRLERVSELVAAIGEHWRAHESDEIRRGQLLVAIEATGAKLLECREIAEYGEKPQRPQLHFAFGEIREELARIQSYPEAPAASGATG